MSNHDRPQDTKISAFWKKLWAAGETREERRAPSIAALTPYPDIIDFEFDETAEAAFRKAA